MRKRLVRAAFAAVLLLSAAYVGSAYASDGTVSNSRLERQADLPYDERAQVADPADGITVVATSPRSSTSSKLVAFAPDGRTLYYNDTYSKYFDVDPSAEGTATVEYVAAKSYPASRCGAIEDGVCKYNVIERTNLTTGETERVFGRMTNRMWHDVDRIAEDRYLVADIAEDRVFVLNTTTGITTWEWDAHNQFDPRSGGIYPDDWTHLNDVQLLDDGRIAVSMRNHDQVLFLDPETGVDGNWTLGADDRRDVLYEQHNPDFIPAERGGPSLLVADSENDRIVEYQRADGEWNRSWTWSDSRMQWPRDADRLPDGSTLITDSNGGRVFVLSQSGETTWSVDVDTPYEAERLGTGSESSGGRSAAALGLPSQGGDATGGDGESVPLRTRIGKLAHSIVPSTVINGLVFVMPSWIGVPQLLVLAFAALVAIAWVAVEFRWSEYRLRRPIGTDRRE